MAHPSKVSHRGAESGGMDPLLLGKPLLDGQPCQEFLTPISDPRVSRGPLRYSGRASVSNSGQMSEVLQFASFLPASPSSLGVGLSADFRNHGDYLGRGSLGSDAHASTSAFLTVPLVPLLAGLRHLSSSRCLLWSSLLAMSQPLDARNSPGESMFG